MDTAPELTLYAFCYRDERTGKWRDARYKITPEQPPVRAQCGSQDATGYGNLAAIPELGDDLVYGSGDRGFDVVSVVARLHVLDCHT